MKRALVLLLVMTFITPAALFACGCCGHETDSPSCLSLENPSCAECQTIEMERDNFDLGNPAFSKGIQSTRFYPFSKQANPVTATLSHVLPKTNALGESSPDNPLFLSKRVLRV